MLKLHNLTVSIADKPILKKISYTFEKGKVYAIMGPNGSGKSTMAAAVMGHPAFELKKGSKISFNRENITDLEANERSKKGMFMSFQSPIALSGVTIYQLLRFALDGAEDPLTIRKRVKEYAADLHISEDLLSRSLNDGFSGGERKKMEVLQAAMLSPKLLFFDEIDTGVDVDALKAIAGFIKKLATPDRTIIIITHYNRILKYLKPDTVLVLKDGEIAKTGDATLAVEIEKDGYNGLID